MKLRLAVAMLSSFVALAGCTEHASEADKSAAAQAAATRQQLADEAVEAREGVHAAEAQLAQLPPPAKGRYLQVHTAEGWNNPFLLVGWKTMTLRVGVNDAGATAPATPSNGASASNWRVVGPSKRELTLRLIDLPEALAALPQSSWEYGRVVAVEEDPTTPRKERPQMRRNLEAVMAMLNDLDVVVDEWPYGSR